MSEMNPDLAASKQIDLRKHFPVALRLIFQRSFHWFIAFAILLILVSGVDHIVSGDAAEFSARVFTSLATALIFTAAFFLVIKLVYELLYYIMIDYRVENQQLLVSKGVIWRSRATFPLVQLTDLYLERTPIEIIFFLSTLQITTAAAQNGQDFGRAATQRGQNFGGIEGLPFHVARALQTFITELSGTVQPNVHEAEAKQILQQTVPKPAPKPDVAAEESVLRAATPAAPATNPSAAQIPTSPSAPALSPEASPPQAVRTEQPQAPATPARQPEGVAQAQYQTAQPVVPTYVLVAPTLQNTTPSENPPPPQAGGASVRIANTLDREATSARTPTQPGIPIPTVGPGPANTPTPPAAPGQLQVIRETPSANQVSPTAEKKLDEVLDALGKADETIQRMKEEIQDLKNS